MIFKELKDYSIVSLEYGYSVFDRVNRESKKNEKETICLPMSYTNIYTDGEVYEYDKNNPYKVEEYKINNKSYKDINYLEVDNLLIKNHTYLIKQVLADEWVDFCGKTLMPVEKDVQIYVDDKENLRKILRALIVLKHVRNTRYENEGNYLFSEGNLPLNQYEDQSLIENPRVHILKKK
jgi:hypothetical protein